MHVRTAVRVSLRKQVTMTPPFTNNAYPSVESCPMSESFAIKFCVPESEV